MILSSRGRKPSCLPRRWEEILGRGRRFGEGTRTSVLRLEEAFESAVSRSDHRRQTCTPRDPDLSVCKEA